MFRTSAGISLQLESRTSAGKRRSWNLVPQPVFPVAGFLFVPPLFICPLFRFSSPFIQVHFHIRVRVRVSV